jgi:hypothetical protein
MKKTIQDREFVKSKVVKAKLEDCGIIGAVSLLTNKK